MNALFFCLALGPLAIYLLLLGLINVGRRPLLVSGGRDTAALGVALSGFMLLGPMALLMPMAAASRFGVWIWPLLAGLYALVVTLIVLVGRPRLVIYNMTADHLRPILADLVTRLDPQARWAGDTLWLPQLGVHLHIESFTAMRNVSLVAIKPEQPLDGWQRLEHALSAELREIEVARNSRSMLFFGIAAAIAAGIGYSLTQHTDALAQAIREMFQL
ncbi:MAG: hypothetical protein MI757_00770 [Pirellulales bacterium]|nr:hypothetical protein [Pirellulales bacterium]